MSIAFFGEALFDCYAQSSPEDMTQPVSLHANIGGGVLNAAIGAARWLRMQNSKDTPKISFIGGVSNDVFGQRIITLLQNEGIDATQCYKNAAPTALAVVMNDPTSGERSFVFHRSQTADLIYPRDRWDNDWFQKITLFACDTNCMTKEDIFHSNLVALDMAQRNNVMIAIDVNLRPALWENKHEMQARVRRALCHATLIKFSDEELPLIFNSSDEQSNIDQLFALSRHGPLPRILCVSRGAQGCSIYFENSQLKSPINIAAPKTRAVDTTGAGDAFFGALCASTALNPFTGEEKDYETITQSATEAVIFATHTVQYQGALTYSLPSKPAHSPRTRSNSDSDPT